MRRDGRRADIIRVLYGVIRERSGGDGPAVLTALLNIGVGAEEGTLAESS